MSHLRFPDFKRRPVTATADSGFKGLIQRLDYICDPGFTAIWITPPIANCSSLDDQGYDCLSFYVKRNLEGIHVVDGPRKIGEDGTYRCWRCAIERKSRCRHSAIHTDGSLVQVADVAGEDERVRVTADFQPLSRPR